MGRKTPREFCEVNTIKLSTQVQAPTHFGEESGNSQHDDSLGLIMQELQSLKDEMREFRRDVTNLSNQQREVSPHGSLNVITPRSNGPFNCSGTTEFHQPPYFDEELHPLPYGGRRCDFGGRGMPRYFEKVLRPQARHGEPLYDDHEHILFVANLATTKSPTSNFKPWPKKEEVPRGTFEPPTKPKMEERGWTSLKEKNHFENLLKVPRASRSGCVGLVDTEET
ncbi:hypothetical protein M9H77_26871 [Catharanthus roseus]|uniref:Uncharacterized protein n=1 Tax=Catharanthus roseus TaxID=4058 RepID=A0ACC0AAY1_CATRO|nr:hypothetical protein M9H77_26871 [Catharanthus roseus]